MLKPNPQATALQSRASGHLVMFGSESALSTVNPHMLTSLSASVLLLRDSTARVSLSRPVLLLVSWKQTPELDEALNLQIS